MLIKNFPHLQQSEDSACCGPYCIKMLIDFYSIEGFSSSSLVQLCKTSKVYGTSLKDMNKVLKQVGLVKKKVAVEDIESCLLRNIPVLTCLMDDFNPSESHYSIIIGYDKDNYIFSDPYYGKNYKRDKLFVETSLICIEHYLYGVTSE